MIEYLALYGQKFIILSIKIFSIIDMGKVFSLFFLSNNCAYIRGVNCCEKPSKILNYAEETRTLFTGI